MTYYERLDLPEGTNKAKLIRRAYHKKSLEWHPDRWQSMINNVASTSSNNKLDNKQQDDKQKQLDKSVGEFTASLYTLAVQGAFELVVEAYKALMMTTGESKSSKSD